MHKLDFAYHRAKYTYSHLQPVETHRLDFAYHRAKYTYSQLLAVQIYMRSTVTGVFVDTATHSRSGVLQHDGRGFRCNWRNDGQSSHSLVELSNSLFEKFRIFDATILVLALFLGKRGPPVKI